MGSLRHRFVQWLSSDYVSGEFSHLAGARFRAQELRLPGRPGPALISMATVPLRLGFALMLDLWKLVPGVVRETALAALAWDLITVETCYENLVEAENRKGRAPIHLLIATGNVVGAAVERSPGANLVAETGKNLKIWTYRSTPGSFEVHPFCDKASRKDYFTDLNRTLAAFLEEETGLRRGKDRSLLSRCPAPLRLEKSEAGRT